MPRKRHSRVRDLAEYAFMRAIEAASWPIPVRLGLWLGRVLGTLTWLTARRVRAVAESNAMGALGLSRKEASRLVHRVCKNFGANFVEDLMLPRILRRKSLRDFSHVEGEEHLHAALAKGRGAIMVTGHFGNWELAGLALAHVMGEAMAVARPLANPYVEAHALAWRKKAGLTIVTRRGALRHVIRHLQAGGCAAMLIDQNQRSGGVFVDFFGRPAATVPSPAMLALKYDVPVLMGYSWRQGRGSFHCFRCDPPFELIRTGDYQADVAANTALFTRRIEEIIRERPDQWFWLHSRWRKRPPGEAHATTEDDAAAEAEEGGIFQ